MKQKRNRACTSFKKEIKGKKEPKISTLPNFYQHLHRLITRRRTNRHPKTKRALKDKGEKMAGVKQREPAKTDDETKSITNSWYEAAKSRASAAVEMKEIVAHEAEKRTVQAESISVDETKMVPLS